MAEEIERRAKLTLVTDTTSLKNLRDELKKFYTQLGGVPVLSPKFKELQATVESLKATINSYVNQNKNASKEIQDGIKREQAEMDRLEKGINDVNVALEKKRALQTVKDAQRDLGLTGQTSSLSSIEAMMGRLNALNAELVQVDVNSDAFVVLKQKVALAKQELENVGASAHGSTRGMANMGVAMQNLNYVVRDSAYFSQSFAFGVLAIGNNLNPMIDSMMRASKEAKSLNSTFGKEMLGFLKGPGGIVLALSLAVTAFQAVTFAMNKNKSEAEKLQKEVNGLEQAFARLARIKNPFENLTFNIDPEKIGKLISALDEQVKHIEKSQKLLNSGVATSGSTGSVGQEATAVKLNFEGISKAIDKSKEDNKEIIKSLKTQKAEYEAQLIIFKKLKEIGLVPEKIKDAGGKPIEIFDATSLKGVQERIKAINELLEKTPKAELINVSSLLDELKKLNMEEMKIKVALDVKTPKDLTSIFDRMFEGGIEGAKKFNEEQKKLLEEHQKLREEFARSQAELEAGLIQNRAEREKALFKLKMSDEIAFGEQMLTEGIINEDELNAYRKALLQDYENFAVDIHAKEIERWTGLTSILESNFSSLWENVFGEANSLVEQLGQNVLSVLGEVAAEELTHILAKHLFEKAETATTAAVATATATASIATIGAEMVALAAATFPAALAVNIASFGAAGAAAAISAEAASLALTTAMIPKFHDGGIVGSEVNIIAKKGEMVLNDDQQSNLWSMINNGGSRQGSQPINITLQNVMDGKIIDSRVYRILPDVQRQLIREGYMN